MSLSCIELCAGGGGQALGLSQAGFRHVALVENDPYCLMTLRSQPSWSPAVLDADIRTSAFLDALEARTDRAPVDLLAGGVPCPPFSRAGKQLGGNDERDLFPQAIEVVRRIRPRAILLENVRALMDDRFSEYRESVIVTPLQNLGYDVRMEVVNAVRFGVPQARLRTVLVAVHAATDLGRGPRHTSIFERCDVDWPSGSDRVVTVGEALQEEMSRNGWPGAAEWAARANAPAPALVGGSKKHGGPDLGPTQARAQWERLGVNGKLVKLEPPARDHCGMPYLSVRMAALVQGFPADWPFQGAKTHQYRQVGNAFPPPVAKAFGLYVKRLLDLQEDGREPYSELTQTRLVC